MPLGWRIVLMIVVALALGVVALFLYGARRWQGISQGLQQELRAGQETVTPRVVDFAELQTLPEPVQRYFRQALQDGQAMIASTEIWQDGSFNLGQSPTTPQWRAFTAHMLIISKTQGFHWNANIAMPLGLHVRVHDSYVAGHGYLAAALLGAIPVMQATTSAQLDRGELLRFFAEAFWYPTALLPSQGVLWEAVDDYQARATLKGHETISMLVSFDEHYLPTGMVAERPRQIGDAFVLTPWVGRLYDFHAQDGMLLPERAEIGWQLPEGELTYWRGHVNNVKYSWVE